MAYTNTIHAGMGPTACGQIVGCGGETCKIIIQWDDTRAGGALAEQLVTVTRL